LLDSGYDCPEVYGDPAIIMPLIYNPDIEKEYDVSFIVHISKNKKRNLPEIGNVINIGTDDYKKVISQIKASKKIISSSLHGIILAETYGVPAVFVAKDIRTQMMKFYDWYEATGREDFVIASSYEEALELESPALPKLEKIRENLMASFPYDLWT
jgi:pyruvyltransferase